MSVQVERNYKYPTTPLPQRSVNYDPANVTFVGVGNKKGVKLKKNGGISDFSFGKGFNFAQGKQELDYKIKLQKDTNVLTALQKRVFQEQDALKLYQKSLASRNELFPQDTIKVPFGKLDNGSQVNLSDLTGYLHGKHLAQHNYINNNTIQNFASQDKYSSQHSVEFSGQHTKIPDSYHHQRSIAEPLLKREVRDIKVPDFAQQNVGQESYYSPLDLDDNELGDIADQNSANVHIQKIRPPISLSEIRNAKLKKTEAKSNFRKQNKHPITLENLNIATQNLKPTKQTVKQEFSNINAHGVTQGDLIARLASLKQQSRKEGIQELQDFSRNLYNIIPISKDKGSSTQDAPSITGNLRTEKMVSPQTVENIKTAKVKFPESSHATRVKRLTELVRKADSKRSRDESGFAQVLKKLEKKVKPKPHKF